MKKIFRDPLNSANWPTGFPFSKQLPQASDKPRRDSRRFTDTSGCNATPQRHGAHPRR